MNIEPAFLADIAAIWKKAQAKTFTLVNKALIDAYWQIGARIVEEEQKGATRSPYGTQMLKHLAQELNHQLRIDKTFDDRELRKIRQFYLLFPIRDALRPELTWTHYRLLLRVEHPQARSYYLHECADQNWGTRQLERNIQSLYYERLLSTQKPSAVPPNPVAPFQPADLIKDPYVLEFLSLQMPIQFSESELEQAILSKLQQMLLELGKGFAFVGRQYQIKTETKHFYIDLVFYNYLLKCFVLADLKISELSHQDIGQMQMYVRMFDDLRKNPDDNPTIGIILCSEKDATVVKYSVLDDSQYIFASQYRLVLPSEDELSIKMAEERQRLLTNSRPDH